MLDLIHNMQQFYALAASIWPLYLEGMGRVHMFSGVAHG